MDSEGQIRQVAEQWVAASVKGDLQAIGDLMTDDIVLLPPNDTPKIGRDQCIGWMAPFQGKYSISESLQSREIRVSGDIAYEWALFQETFTPKTPSPETPTIELDAKVLRIYHRQPDGSWKIARASWSNKHP